MGQLENKNYQNWKNNIVIYNIYNIYNIYKHSVYMLQNRIYMTENLIIDPNNKI